MLRLLFAGLAVASENPLSILFSKSLDLNRDGVLSRDELLKIGSMYAHTGRPVESAELDLLFELIDTDKDGVISYPEYEKRYPQLTAPFKGDPTPEQIHLALSNVDGMAVSWCSYIDSEKTPPQPASAVVKFGTSPGVHDHIISGALRTYDVGLFGGWHGWISDVVLRPLVPGTRYYYVVGDGTNFSMEYSFVQPIQGGSKPTVMVALGDQGTTIPVGFEVSALLSKDLTSGLAFDVVAHIGDLCYATMAFGDSHEWELVWDQWGRQISSTAALVPYMTTVGNHEKVYNFTAYRNRFHMPGDVDGGEHNFWFSYSVGQIAYVSMSTEHPYDVGTPQYTFLESELKRFNASRSTYPWIFVGGHRPMYSSAKSEYNQHCPGAHLQSVIEPLLIKYGVDAYMGGHMHVYERTHPCVNGSVVSTPDKDGVYNKPSAPLGLVLGTGGVFLSLDAWNDGPPPSWSATRADTHWGYGRLTAHNASVLEYKFHTLKGDIFDSAFIRK